MITHFSDLPPASICLPFLKAFASRQPHQLDCSTNGAQKSTFETANAPSVGSHDVWATQKPEDLTIIT